MLFIRIVVIELSDIRISQVDNLMMVILSINL